MEDELQLGGNIRLSGFNEISKPELSVLKKIIGSYARKFSDNLEGYQSLSLHLKGVHRTEASEKFEVHGKVEANGKINTSEVTDRNIFVAVDSVLKKLESLAL